MFQASGLLQSLSLGGGGVRGEAGLNHSASTKKTNPDARGREAWELEQTPGNSHPYKAGSKAEGRKPPTPPWTALANPLGSGYQEFQQSRNTLECNCTGQSRLEGP